MIVDVHYHLTPFDVPKEGIRFAIPELLRIAKIMGLKPDEDTLIQKSVELWSDKDGKKLIKLMDNANIDFTIVCNVDNADNKQITPEVNQFINKRISDIAKEYPLILTTGGRVRPLFHSEMRQFGIGMREQHPDPLMDIPPDTAGKLGISDGDWVCIENLRGVIKQKARVTDAIHPSVINVESHWWFPEQPAEEPSLYGLWQSNANVLTLDDPDKCDPITGGWALRALLCKVYKVPALQ